MFFDRKKFREYAKKYYALNDKAHQIDHADEVWNEAVRLVSKMNIALDKDLLYLAVYSHDIRVFMSRKNHHIHGYRWLLNSKLELLKWFSSEEIMIAANAVLEHRSSSKLPPSNKYSYILQLADKGRPNLDKILERSIKYHMSKEGGSADKITMHVGAHILEKFTRNGYAFSNPNYRKVYADEIEDFFKEVNKLTARDIKRKVVEVING